MHDKKVLILYGSQTGCSQDIAERIWREAKYYQFFATVMCMDDYSVSKLIYEPLVVFVASTTGQGEEPDNMKMFWKFLLRRSLPSDSLKNVRFAVLGLGDSSYVKFNYVAKRLTRRLANLGGVSLIDSGYADEQHDLGVDAVVDSWLNRLWEQLGTFYNFSAGIIDIKLEPRWRVTVVQDGNGSKRTGQVSGSEEPQYTQRYPCQMRVRENLRTTAPSHFQDVRLIKLDVPQTLKYNPGDVLMLVPQNSEKNVNLLFEIINKDRSKEERIDPILLVHVGEKDGELPVPETLRHPIRLRECAKKYWDLNVVPRRHTFALLAEVTANELEKEKLKEFSAATGQENLYNYCNRPKRTVLEVLADFPGAARAVPLDMLFDVLQPIKPRAFSIASSIKMHPGEIHVLLAVVEYKTKLLAPRQGLCSTYLADLPEGSTLYGWIRPGSFRFPPPTSPVIMVGPGTGVAPFRSYVQELAACNTASSPNQLLFFGCRNREADFHFRKEWEDLVKSKSVELVTAFSRDQTDKVYVQHEILQHGATVWERLSRGGVVLVAGSSKNMPASVREAFVTVVQQHGNLDSQQAEAYVQQLEKSGRYQTETWG